MSDDPMAWLRRRIEERLYLARHAIELGNAVVWHEQSSGVLVTGEPTETDTWHGTRAMGDSSLARLMEANDPQDTIARCEAELAILDEHRGEPSEWGGYRDDGTWQQRGLVCMACGHDDGRLGVAWPCRTVRLLASGCRHHEGYQEAWGP